MFLADPNPWLFKESGSILKELRLECDAIRSEQFENGHFFKPKVYEPRVKASSEQTITFARHEYGMVGVFRIKMRISSEFTVSRKVKTFKLFPFYCITL